MWTCRINGLKIKKLFAALNGEKVCVRVCVSIGVSVCGWCFHVPGRRTMCLTCCILVFTNNTFNSDTVLFPFVLIFSLHVIN